MNRREVMDLINEIEELFPVDTWMVDDIHVWPLIRIPLAMNLYREMNGKDIINNPLSFHNRIIKKINGIFISLKALISDIEHNARYKRKVDVVILSNTICRTKLNDGWYDRICDPFVEEINKMEWSSQFYEATQTYEYRLPRIFNSTLIQLKLDYINLKSKMNWFFSKSTSYQLDSWNDFYLFAKEKGINYDVPSFDELIQRVFRIRRLSHFFEHFLKYNQPKLAFVECYYGENGMALNLACKRKGIPSVDIQHGVQGEFHVAYGRWCNIPDTGYELLPSHFWCWTPHEADVINSWSENLERQVHNALVGSNLWLNKWIRGDVSSLKFYDTKIRGLIESKKTAIMFTLQPGFDPELWFYEAVNSSPTEWKWFIRLHPGMIADKERFQTIFKSQCPNANIELDHATELPLLAWLRHIDIHVTQFSTCIIEAETFGVPSIITHVNGMDMYADQIQKGTACTAFTAIDLINRINILSNEKNGSKYPNDSKSKQNILFKQIINEILEERPGKNHQFN